MFIRAAVHIHSTWSHDGCWDLAPIAGAFIARGYNLLLMTEHDQGFTEERRIAYRDACASASSDHLLIISGIEYSDPLNRVHTLAWGNVRFQGVGMETRHVLEHATEQGGVCVLAHPSRRAAWKEFRKEWFKYLAGVEIWNRKTDGWCPSPEAMEIIRHTGAAPIVSHDFHSARQFFPFAVSMPLEGPPTEDNVLDALRQGSFHCEVFGMDLRTFTSGLPRFSLQFLEQCRRLAARASRSFITQR